MGNSPEAGNNLLVLDIYKLCGETYTWILGKKKKKIPKKNRMSFWNLSSEATHAYLIR